MRFFTNNDKKEAFGICHSCQTPIFDGIWRQLQLKDQHGEDFSLNYHYFPPCFVRGDVLIPENCEFLREGYGASKSLASKSLASKFPFLDKELVNLDDKLDTQRRKSSLEDYR